MTSVTLKLVLPDKTLRRITVAGDVTFESFQVLAKRIAGVDPVFLAFQDEDGDFITLASSGELAEFLNHHDGGAGKVKKLFISAQPVAQESPAAAAAQEAAQEAEPVDERSPLERLASALAKPDTVRELQKALGESPVVVDAITGVANAFLTAGLPGAFAAGKDQIPLVVAVAEEAAARDPELDAAVKDLRRQHDDGEQNGEPWFAGLHRHHPMAAFMGPFLGGPWHHGFGGHHHHHHPCGGPAAAASNPTAATPSTDKPVHAFVVCDGCDNDADLKARAKAAGTISMRGWILGDRFKSQTVPDFDLCETCNATGRFAGYGPFENVPPRFGGRGGCGGGQFRCGGPGRHAHAHAHAHAQQQQRGCRGSRKNAFAEVLAETIKSVTEAVAESANEDSEVAQIARAVRDSLLSANAKPQAQAQQQQQPAAAAAAKPAVPPAQPVVVPEAPKVPVATPAEDPVDATWEHVDPMVKWSAQLQKLHALGFTDVETYIPMLEEEQGDLEKVVNRIIRRNA